MTAAELPIQTPTGTQQPASGIAAEPIAALPTGTMLAAACGGAITTAVLWGLALLVIPAAQGTLPTALAAIGLVLVIYIATTMMITPWKPRRMGDWMTFWLAATVVRLLVTPVAAWVLYSAALLEVRPFGLAVALCYVLCLFLETGTIAWFLNRRLTGNDDSTSTPADSQAGSVGGSDQP